jgi:hypothetical protein
VLLSANYPYGIKKVVEQRKENENSGVYTDDDSNVYVTR